MFKKAAVQSQNKLRGTDVKRLKKDVQLALPTLSDADVEAAFPSKCVRVCSRRRGGGRTHWLLAACACETFTTRS